MMLKTMGKIRPGQQLLLCSAAGLSHNKFSYYEIIKIKKTAKSHKCTSVLNMSFSFVNLLKGVCFNKVLYSS